MIAARLMPTRIATDAVAVGNAQRCQLDELLLVRDTAAPAAGSPARRRSPPARRRELNQRPQCGGTQATSVVSRICAIAAQRDHGAQHRQPQEQEVGQLVGPEERAVEHVARDDAGEQDDDLGQRPASAPTASQTRPMPSIQHGVRRGAVPASPAAIAEYRRSSRPDWAAVDAHQASGPTYFSSSAQASSPDVFFISG